MENSSPLISVVLPVYNVELYIKEAIDSILNQTIQDFEILVIDDNSTDDTLGIVKSFNDCRIKIVEKAQNLGLIHSLNLGFELAKGKYIARMDGDDISKLDRFQKQLDILENYTEIDVCGCWLKCFGANDKIIKHKEHHHEIQAQLLLSNPMSLGTVMFEKSAFEAFRFDSKMVHVEDYDYWARAVWDCKYYNIQEVLYYYRIHDEQVSNKYKKMQLAGDITIKLRLFKKLDYSETKYKDNFLIKVLYTIESISSKEMVQFRNWIKVLLKQNRNKNIFSQTELNKVVSKLEENLINTLFFTNKRKGITKNERKVLFRVLSLRWKGIILIKKIHERINILIKK